MSEKVIRLCEECSKGNLKKIKKILKGSLLKKGVPVNAVSSVKISMLSGMTPLMCASMFGRTYVAEYLISEGADVNARSIGIENTALIYAASNNNLVIAKLLLKHNADKTLKNREGLTALDYAEKHKYSSIVSLLRDIPLPGRDILPETAPILDAVYHSSGSEEAVKKEDAVVPVKAEVMQITEQKLITLRLLLGGARAWGSLNGAAIGREYPQYNKIREIGMTAFSENGDEGLNVIKEKIRSDGSDLCGYLDLMWNNLQNEGVQLKKMEE